MQELSYVMSPVWPSYLHNNLRIQTVTPPLVKLLKYSKDTQLEHDLAPQSNLYLRNNALLSLVINYPIDFVVKHPDISSADVRPQANRTCRIYLRSALPKDENLFRCSSSDSLLYIIWWS